MRTSTLVHDVKFLTAEYLMLGEGTEYMNLLHNSLFQEEQFQKWLYANNWYSQKDMDTVARSRAQFEALVHEQARTIKSMQDEIQQLKDSGIRAASSNSCGVAEGL